MNGPMNAAPTPVYNYAYTAWAGRVEQPIVFIGEIEAHSAQNARGRIRALHKTIHMRAPRTIKLAAPQFLRLSTDGPLRIRFHRNSKPHSEIADVSVIRASFPAFLR